MPLRVLLADDHPIVRQGFRGILEREGLDVVGEATNGQEAIDLALTLAPDVVVLDVSMPVLNGLAAVPGIGPALAAVVAAQLGAGADSMPAVNLATGEVVDDEGADRGDRAGRG